MFRIWAGAIHLTLSLMEISRAVCEFTFLIALDTHSDLGCVSPCDYA